MSNFSAMTMPSDFKSSVSPQDSQASDAWWFIYSGYRLLVKTSNGAGTIPLTEEPHKLGIEIEYQLYLGELRGRACYAAAGSVQDNLGGFHFAELRSLFSSLENGLFEVALLGVHLIEWDKTYRFCCKCRAELVARQDVRAKECPECRRLEFPRLSPAIIVLIEKDNTVLLARSPRFAGEFFSVLAGFVEPGESLEAAVHREVMEETGIAIKNVNYFGSQPWPFPDSLMIGFTAQYKSGDIRIDGQEIIEAGWFQADGLPKVPGKLSIARRLIDWFVEKHSQRQENFSRK
jgi:NAD+ diphosphatase